MTIEEFELAVRKKILTDFPAVLEKAELPPLEYYDSPPDVETCQNYMGVYLYGPDGMTFELDDKTMKVALTIDGLINLDAADSELSARYLSTLTSWLFVTYFGCETLPIKGRIFRVDSGDAYNGFAVLLVGSIDYLYDGLTG